MEFLKFASLLAYGKSIIDEHARAVVEFCADNFETFQRFSIPERCDEVTTIVGDFVMPYDLTLIRFERTGQDIFCFCVNKDDGKVIVTAFASLPNGNASLIAYFSMDHERVYACDEGKRYRATDDVEDDIAASIHWFISLLNHPDQRIQTYEPSHKLNKKRARRGDEWLVSYKTLEILKPRIIHVPLPPEETGTHASPRIHTRRSHYRNYPSGKRCLVREAIVGDKARGMLLKDYKVITNASMAH